MLVGEILRFVHEVRQGSSFPSAYSPRLTVSR